MKKLTKINWDGKLIQLIELFFDVSIIITVYITSIILISGHSINELISNNNLLKDLAMSTSLLGISVLILFRVYNISIVKRNFITTMVRIVISLGIVGVMMTLASYLSLQYALPKTAIPAMIFTLIVLFLMIKGLSFVILTRLNYKTCIVIGPKEEADELAIKILYGDNAFIHIKYIIYSDFPDDEFTKIYEYIDLVDHVYMTENLSSIKKDYIISYCFENNKKFYLVPKLYELSINNAKLSQTADMLLYEIKSLNLTLEQRFLKRTFDLLVSVTTLVILFPLLIIVSLLVKLSDGGPVFYKQERITRNNRKFILYKFRTMIPNAEDLSGPVLATDHDPRITKIGRFLRATRIDELPQLINIIRSEMSIVGPRPEREFFINQFIKEEKDYRFRLNVKSGVTGLAQALGTYNTTYKEKLRFDIYYITNYSFINDIVILLYTIKSIFDPNSSKGLSVSETIEKILLRNNYLYLSTDEPYVKIIVNK